MRVRRGSGRAAAAHAAGGPRTTARGHIGHGRHGKDSMRRPGTGRILSTPAVIVMAVAVAALSAVAAPHPPPDVPLQTYDGAPPAPESALGGMMLPPAYGHGLGLDRIPSVAAGSQKIVIHVEMPQELADGSNTERITITATDATTRQPAEDIIYRLGASHGGQTVFRDYFLASDGVLALDVEAARGDNPAIVGERGGGGLLPDAWRPAGDSPVRIDGSAFGHGGLYTFDVAVHAIGGDVIAEPDTYYADLSIIESTTHAGTGSDGSPAAFGTKSYFDQIESLEYDAESGLITIVMPFDWSEARMSHIPVVHVETHFPKDFLEFHSPGYEGYANGVKLFKASVITDDYTLEDERIVHFVLLQDHTRFVKNEMKKTGEPFPDSITFTLAMAEELEFPLVAYTISEEFLVNLSWDPPEILPGEETTFVFTIRDGRTGEPLRNSDYTFVIEQGGDEIHRTSGQARIGGQFVKFTFAEDQTGPTTIKFEDIRGTGQETEFGILVVPEFGAVAAAMLAAAGATAVALHAASRYNGRAKRAEPALTPAA